MENKLSISTSIKVLIGLALRAKALIPSVGSFKTLVEYCSFIFGCGRGDIAVFDGVTLVSQKNGNLIIVGLKMRILIYLLLSIHLLEELPQNSGDCIVVPTR